MDVRRIEVDCQSGDLGDPGDLDGGDAIIESRVHDTSDGGQRVILLVRATGRQKLIDAIESKLEGDEDWRLVVMPVDALLPLPEDLDENSEATGESEGATREEIFNQVYSGTQINTDVVVLLVASSIVACGGMLNDNTAVVIGAMLIAPLLGPILSLVLGAALGERWLIVRSLATVSAGFAIVAGVGCLVGLAFDVDPDIAQLAQRTDAGFDTIVLALASGAAAALSVTSRQVATMVGVMVAAALMPPIVAAGLYAGAGEFALAGRAAVLVGINVVCINLAGQLVFIWKGVRPRTWYERKKARQSVVVSLSVMSVSLLVLAGVIYLMNR